MLSKHHYIILTARGVRDILIRSYVFNQWHSSKERVYSLKKISSAKEIVYPPWVVEADFSGTLTSFVSYNGSGKSQIYTPYTWDHQAVYYLWYGLREVLCHDKNRRSYRDAQKVVYKTRVGTDETKVKREINRAASRDQILKKSLLVLCRMTIGTIDRGIIVKGTVCRYRVYRDV